MRRLASGFGLLEAARWYPDWGLVFSDMTGGGVYHLRGDDSPAVLIPHRKGIGGLVAHAAGGFVVSGRNVARKPAGGETEVLLTAAPDEMFFNDLTADPAGRLLVGSVAVDPLHPGDGDHGERLGRLYRIDADGTPSILFEDVVVSNGLGAAPDGSIIYHVDTGRRLVWAIETDRGGSREVFADTSDHAGEPDGLAVAEDGSVWVAMAEGGLVVAWDKAGRPLGEVEVPQKMVTSVCFGGVDRRSLFVLTGPSRHDQDGQGGCIYVYPAPVAGLAAPVARVTPALGAPS